LAGGDFAFDAKDAGGTGGEELNHAHEGKAARVDELFESEREGGFEAQNAEGSAVEFDVFERRFVRSMIRGNSVDRAIGETRDERLAILTSGQRRIHFEARIVLHVFIHQSEMVRRDFARDAEAARLGPADLLERSFCGEMRNVKTRAGEFGELNVARNTNRFRGGGHAG